jgi:hypothetical protein
VGDSMTKTPEEKSMSLTIMGRSNKYDGDLDEDLCAFAAQEVEAYKARLKDEMRKEFADWYYEDITKIIDAVK